ncbi:hypothetical protein J6590_081264 [Homalodisca vitripennis]|nr:hypothetical protein J6590_081264 [Homalodisca vitripennis]
MRTCALFILWDRLEKTAQYSACILQEKDAARLRQGAGGGSEPPQLYRNTSYCCLPTGLIGLTVNLLAPFNLSY